MFGCFMGCTSVTSLLGLTKLDFTCYNVFMSYERFPKNPGSSAEFAKAHRDIFAAQVEKFKQQIGIAVEKPLGAPASAEVIEKTNSLPPTPEV